LRRLRAAIPKTRFQMLLRGQNIVGYHNYPDDVVIAFIQRAASDGIDVFRIFDAMNDLRNMKTAIEAALKTGKLVEGTICYTISPVHSVDYFLRVAERLAELGVQIICLKDMAGMLAPYAAEELISKIKARIPLPLHLHSHCTAGLAPMTYMLAIEAGADILDTAISPLSQGTSQPATEAVVAALMGSSRDTELDLGKLNEIAEYFYGVRTKYTEFEQSGEDRYFDFTNPRGNVVQSGGAATAAEGRGQTRRGLKRDAPRQKRSWIPALSHADQPDRRLSGGTECDHWKTLFCGCH
jgi:pyruvate carboxylase subunit B